jgi:hypothetical protein
VVDVEAIAHQVRVVVLADGDSLAAGVVESGVKDLYAASGAQEDRYGLNIKLWLVGLVTRHVSQEASGAPPGLETRESG